MMKGGVSALRKDAERLASVMHDLAVWPKNEGDGAGLLRLPPIFLRGVSGERTEGLRNLVAMINTLCDYEEGRKNGTMTLVDVTDAYRSHGGTLKEKGPSSRTVHNWLQQVAFNIRAAMIDDAIRKSSSTDDVAQRVCSNLFDEDNGIPFVARSQDNPNEYRPLRYATAEATHRWVKTEAGQRMGAVEGLYGAVVNDAEWSQYGIGSQMAGDGSPLRKAATALKSTAKNLDVAGRHTEADEYDMGLFKLVTSMQKVWNN